MKSADLIIFSKAIFDGLHDEPYAGGIAVSDGRIAFIGKKSDALNFIGNNTVVRDFGSGLVTPGFCDSHMHFFGGAARLAEGLKLRLPSELKSERECMTAIRDFAKKYPGRPYYIGIGWNHTEWDVPIEPTRFALDGAFPDIPVAMMAYDAHTVWTNTAAIRMCDLEKLACGFPAEWSPRGRDGNLLGIFREELCLAVTQRIPDMLTSPEIEEKTADAQKHFISALNKVGVTSVHEMTMFSPESVPGVFRNLEEWDRSGALTVRVNIYAGAGADVKNIPAVADFRDRYNGRLRLAGIKEAMDGSEAAYTAYLNSPYTDRPETAGTPKSSVESFSRFIAEANRAGLPVRVHCVGDGAVRLVLDANALAKEKNGYLLRNAIEHLEITAPDDVPRFAKLGVTAAIQPALITLSPETKMLRYGAERMKSEGIYRTIRDTGAHIVLGTDNFINDFNPYETMLLAATHRDASDRIYGIDAEKQCLTLAETIRCFTSECAWLCGMEKNLGTLEPGKLADISVASGNLFSAPPEMLMSFHNVCTVFEGRIVYEE